MNGQQWQRSSDPQILLSFLIRGGGRTSKRKTRLFACACCRRIWHLVKQIGCARFVEVAERFADDIATLPELTAAHVAATRMLELVTINTPPAVPFKTDSILEMERLVTGAMVSLTNADIKKAVIETTDLTARAIMQGISGSRFTPVWEAERRSQAVLLRHIVGNPYHIGRKWAHLLSLVPLALAVYEGDPLAVRPLCDALYEAGHHEMAAHFEDPDHPRGCWAIDLLLGKS